MKLVALTHAGKKIAVNADRIAYITASNDSKQSWMRIYFSGIDDDYLFVDGTYDELIKRLAD